MIARQVLSRVYRALPSVRAKSLCSGTLSRFLQAANVKTVRGGVGDRTLYVSTADPWGLRHFYLQNTYDIDALHRYRVLVERERLTFWDIGASYGAYTLFVGRSAPRVIAAEPSSVIFSYLERNCRAAGLEAVLERCAIGDRGGETLYFSYADHSGDGRSYQPANVRGWRTESVLMKTVDQIAREQKIPGGGRHFIKVDVQGSEVRVLRGAREFLSTAHCVYVLLEVWPDGLRQAGTTLDGLIRVCREIGLRPAAPYPESEWNRLVSALGGKCVSQMSEDVLLVNGHAASADAGATLP